MENNAQQIDRLNEAIAQLYQQGRYAQAVPMAIQARDLICQELGADHPAYAQSLNDLGMLYQAIGNYTTAEPLLRQASGIWNTALGATHPDYAQSLNNLAALYYDMGNYTAAEPLYRQASDIWCSVLGTDHPDYATSLNNLAQLYRAMGNYADAERFYRQALALTRKALGTDHPDYATSLNNLARLYQAMGNYAEAEPLYQRASAIDRKALGEDHPGYATDLNNLAGLYLDMGDYAAAEPLYRQALEIAHTALGGDHPDYAANLNNLAELYQTMGDYAAAEPLLRQALEITHTALGVSHPDYAASLNNLAELYLDMGDYAAAEPLYRQALEITRTALGGDHPDYATKLNSLAGLYHDTGHYAEAEPLYRQASDIRRSVLGTNHPDYATSLNNLALLYQAMGNYAVAEPLYRQASDIRRSVLGTKHPAYATSLNNLAGLYLDMGHYAEAEPLYRQALDIRRTALGANHPAYATSLNNLAGLYLDMGHYTAAKQLYQRASEIDRKALGENHPGYATSLNNLAGLYLDMGDYAAAEPLYRQALKIAHTALGADHPDYATKLNNLAFLYWTQGNYAAAEPLYRQALEITRTALGADHPDYAASLNNLSDLCVATGRKTEAISLVLQAAAIHDRMLGQVSSFGADSQRMAYLGTLRVNFFTHLSLIVQYFPHALEVVQTGLDLILRRKALAAQRDAILGGRYPALAPQLRELTLLRAQIAQQTLAGLGSDDPKAHRQRLAEWMAEHDRLEADLARQIPEMNLEQQLHAADRLAVAQALPAGTALVEFVRVDIFNFTAVPARGEPRWTPARYLAFVLAAGAPDDVVLLDLGEAAPIDHLIATFRQAISGEADGADQRDAWPTDSELPEVSTRSDRPTLRTALVAATRSMRPRAANAPRLNRAELGAALRQALFDPLLPALAGRTRLFLAPDGGLTRLPFEVLPLDDQRCVIDAYQISYLSVGRDVMRFAAVSPRQLAAPLVVADPDFDLGNRGVETYSAGVPFRRLAGTRQEGQQVAKLLQVPPLLDDAALEQTLKAHPSPRILHIATHGFFLQDPKRDPNQDRHVMGTHVGLARGNLGRLSMVENPLLRTGLALAGANTWLQAHEQALDAAAEDGILNGVDVSGLNLLDTELVVLSACDTGLGSVQVGEGVFGLRRAFVLAGAKTLVMSLWKVPDRQTQELMELFYHHVLEGIPRADALRAAQLSMKAKYPDPLYWGAFICQGDPGPLTTS